MVMQKTKIQEIKVIEKTVSIESRYWSIDEIHAILTKIQKEKDFHGFIRIHFDVEEFPQVTYYIRVGNAKD